MPLSAVAQVAGGAPVLNFRIAETPISVSIASSRALRVATANCKAMIAPDQNPVETAHIEPRLSIPRNERGD